MNDIEEAYATTWATTLAAWAEHAGVGEPVPPAFDKHFLGIATGRRFTASGWILELHRRLCEWAEEDPLLDVVPSDCLHFTFLALAKSKFVDADEIPVEIQSVREAHLELVSSLVFRMHRLRLLPLKNALLLAGIPDQDSFQTRKRFAEALLRGPWEDHLRSRYDGFQIPPLLWHSTIARYEAEYLPPEIRDLYHEYDEHQTEMLEIGTPMLAAHNYNWTSFVYI